MQNQGPIRTLPRRALRAAAPLLAVAACLALMPCAGAETIRFGGSGAGLGTVKALLDAQGKLDRGLQVEPVPNLGSSGGIKALAAGSIRMAVISRPLRPEEIANGLKASEIGQTAFVLATAKADAPGLSLDQVADLYAGRLRRWPDGQPMRLVLRPPSDVDAALLAALSPAVKEAAGAASKREGLVTAMTDQDSVDAIERLPGGVGTASLSLLLSERRTARPIALDGVTPSLETLADGRYPHRKTLWLASRDDDAVAARFLAFVRSPDGRRVLRSHGVLPADAQSGHR